MPLKYKKEAFGKLLKKNEDEIKQSNRLEAENRMHMPILFVSVRVAQT